MATRYEGYTYARWMIALDQRVRERTGLSASDLPDYQFRDAYEDDREAKDCADELLEQEGF